MYPFESRRARSLFPPKLSQPVSCAFSLWGFDVMERSEDVSVPVAFSIYAILSLSAKSRCFISLEGFRFQYTSAEAATSFSSSSQTFPMSEYQYLIRNSPSPPPPNDLFLYFLVKVGYRGDCEPLFPPLSYYPIVVANKMKNLEAWDDCIPATSLCPAFRISRDDHPPSPPNIPWHLLVIGFLILCMI